VNITLFTIALVLYISVPIILSFIASINQLKVKRNQRYIVLQIKVPKENESSPMVTEQIFATLQGIKTKFSKIQKLKGKSSDTVSFELLNVNRTIQFAVTIPAKLRNLIEGQLFAQYPEVEIKQIDDYARIGKITKNAIGTELEFTSSQTLPIKRYQQFADNINKTLIDPLSSITASIANLENIDDQAWIQVITTPLSNESRKRHTKCMKNLNNGVAGNIGFMQDFYIFLQTTEKSWPKFIFFSIYWIYSFKATIAKKSEDAVKVEETTNSKHEGESSLKASMDKVLKPLFKTTIRIVYIPKIKNDEHDKIKLNEIVSTFQQFNTTHLNGFKAGDTKKGKEIVTLYRKRIINTELLLNSEELATVWHLPNINVKTPAIFWVKSRKLEAPTHLPTDKDKKDTPTILGETNFRNRKDIFGIKPTDRRRHVYVIGKTGMGKSTLLENMIFSDIQASKGVGVIDPHGDLAEAVLSFIPPSRTNDVVLIDPSDAKYAVSFNMLENVDPALRSIVCSGLVGIFKKIYADSWGPRLEHILRNTLLTLLEYPGTSMLGITRLLQDPAYRKKVVKKVTDPIVKSFWVDEFEKMQPRFQTEAIAPIQNKVGQFLSSSTIRNIVGQNKSTIDLRFAMDKGKIVIVNLSKGKIGEDNSSLLGAMFITKFQLDAMSRANIPSDQRRDFYLYVDEFQNFATDSFATILSEARKYKLNLTMANQYIAQMPDEVRNAVFGNVGSILSFQVGYDDAEYISKQYGEEVLPNDLVSLDKYTAYTRILIDGMPTKTFSLRTLPPPVFNKDVDQINKVIKVSRERYSRKTSDIAEKISKWTENQQENIKDARKEYFKNKGKK